MIQDTPRRSSFQEAALFVRACGEHKLASGQSLSEALSFDGVSMWQAISPMFTVSHVAKALGCQAPLQTGGASLFLKSMKSKLRSHSLRFHQHHHDCSRRVDWLLLGFSEYIYKETLAPVQAYLESIGEEHVAVLNDAFFGRWRVNGDRLRDTFSINDFYDAAAAARLRHLQQSYLAALDDITKSRFSLAMVASQPHSVRSALLASFAWLFGVQIPRLLVAAAELHSLFQAWKPRVILSCDVNDPRSRLVQLMGERKGVPSIDVQFGFYNVDDTEWCFQLGQIVAATGSYNQATLRVHGVPDQKIVVTGTPRYDKIEDWAKSADVESIREQYGISANQKFVLFASQPYYYGSFASLESRNQMIRALFSEARDVQAIKVVVKPHPLEDQSEIDRLVDEYPGIIKISGRANIRPLIVACDAFVTFYSQTAFDAMVLDKPVMNLDFPRAYEYRGFREWGATYLASDASEVAAFLRIVGDNRVNPLRESLASKRSAVLNGWFNRLDGRSSERIVSLAKAAFLGDAPAHV